LSEAECYARCYGGRGEERVSFARAERTPRTGPEVTGEQLRRLFERSLDEREPGQEAA
jgi:hypothetical protein